MKGDVCEGSWCDHVIGWWQAYQRYSQEQGSANQIFWIYFEDMKKNPEEWYV
jgi:hypothetical protein